MGVAVTTRGAVSVRFADSIADEIEAAYDEITRRAYELFLTRPGGGAIDIEDWLEAEKEVLIKPPCSVARMGDRIEISVDLKDAVYGLVEIVVAGGMLLVHSLGAASPPRVFRTICLPAPIDGRTAYARFDGALLIFTADLVFNTSFNVS